MEQHVAEPALTFNNDRFKQTVVASKQSEKAKGDFDKMFDSMQEEIDQYVD